MLPSFLLLLLPLVALADPHAAVARNSLAHRRHSRATTHQLQRRDRATFYDVGLGACGKRNVASDFVIALNVPQYAGGSRCFQMVTISYQGKTTQAQVVDECEGCPYGAIDMSRGLFDFFASESQGQIDVQWSFGGGSPAPPPAAKPPPPPPPAPSPTPSPTSTKSTSSSTWSASSTSTTSSSSTKTKSSTSAGTSSTAAPTPSTSVAQNLEDLRSLVGALGQIVLTST